MAAGEDEDTAGRRASVRNEVHGRVGSVVQAGSINGDVVIGAEPGRGASGRDSWSELDEWAEGLARAVRSSWQAEEAHRQVHDPVPLPVRWHPAPAPLMDHWANIRRRPAGDEPEPLPLAGRLERIAEIYEMIPSRRLVVLGPAGAGKTVLGGRLALDLLATRGVGQPVPVIVSIGTWNPATTSLHTWLVEQLLRDHPGLAATAKAGDSSSRAEALVAAERILPILDGFDEIESGLHEAAVRQLNSHVQTPLVITSREAEYAAAVRDADVVTAAGVVVLEELTPRDLAAYLPRTTAGYRTGMWDAVLERVAIQPHAPDSARLRRVLTNPLMVFLARTVYSDTPGQDPARLLDPDRFPTDQALREHLLAAFVPAVYRPDHPGPAGTTGHRARRRWSGEQAGRYLTYLTNHLHRAGTRDLAWWQLRDSIPRPGRTVLLAAADALVAMLAIGIMSVLRGALAESGPARVLTFGLVTMLASGLTVAVTAGLAAALADPRLGTLPRFLTGKTTVALGTGLTIALVSGLAFLLAEGITGNAALFEGEAAFAVLYGLTGGIAAWTVGLRGTGPRPSRTRLRIRGRGQVLNRSYGSGYLVGFATVVAAMIVGNTADPLLHDVGVFQVGRDIGLMVGLATMLAYGFEAPLNADEVVSPAESLARDRRNSLRKMLVAALAIALPYGLEAAPEAGIAIGIAIGWISVRATSAWFLWLVFVRGWLPLTGRLPWRVQTFLTDAHQRGVLRRTGAVYQFRHATLQDHLTTGTSASAAATDS